MSDEPSPTFSDRLLAERWIEQQDEPWRWMIVQPMLYTVVARPDHDDDDDDEAA
jgi:hypothetical protein